ncbi:MAG: lamin tail domain-containing protein [Thermoplasmata archaeon]|nr:MAG: lamin tail domain-containing protein [Thermoplasmata archaeon]
MIAKTTKSGAKRAITIFLVAVLMLGGFVINPFGFLKFQDNAQGTSMTVFFEDFDSGTGSLPWIGSSGIWTDPVNYPSGFGFSNWEVVMDASAPSPTNCLYSGPEQEGFYDPAGWYYGTCTNAETPTIDLQNASSATLTFMHRYNFPGTSYLGSDDGTGFAFGDGGMVFISTDFGGTWDYIEPEEKYTGYVGGQPTWYIHPVFGILGGMNPYEPFGDHDELYDLSGGGGPYQLLLASEGGGAYVDFAGGWMPATFDLSDYVGYEVIISFRYTQNWEDQFGTDTWWYIDDVRVEKEIIDGPRIQVVGSDSQIVNQGETFSYILEITNWKNVADWIDVNYFSTMGWTIELLNYTTNAPLTDDGGIVGLVDIGWLGPEDWIWIRVNVTVPAGEDWDVEDITSVIATSAQTPNKSSTEELFTSTPAPDVGVIRVTIPPDRPPGISIDISAVIHNWGTEPATFYVQCTVEGSLLIQPPVYNQTGYESLYNVVVDLAPDGEVTLFWNFTPEIESPYTITITTLLDIDQNPANNRSSGICYVQSKFWTWNDIPDGDDDSEFDLWDSGAGTVWEWGNPTIPGPSSAYEGVNCWGTDLNAAYMDNTGCMLYTRSFDFSSATSVTISFWHWYDIHGTGGPPNRDWGYFSYDLDSDIGDYIIPEIDAYQSTSGGWVQDTYDVSSIAVGQSFFRFVWYLEEIGNFDPDHAGWYVDNITVYASIPAAELKITEIQDNDSAGNEFIEVYNEGNSDAQLADYGVSFDGGATWIAGNWYDDLGPITVLAPDDYGWFAPTNPDSLNDEGGEILIANTSALPQGLIHDEIRYGQKGLVPDPITGKSVVRWWNGATYTDDWAREPTSSIGFAHWGNKTVYNPLVVINEVHFNPSTQERFIEIVYAGKAGDPDVDITGWVVAVDGIPYTIPAGPWETNLNLTNRLYVINETMANSVGSEIFTFMDMAGDNVYLYNSTGSLVDMVGWSNPHTPGTSIVRVPDGFGVTIGFETFALDGYDDPTSIEAGWQFVNNPTMGIIVLEKDQTKVGDLGDTIIYILSLANDAYGDIIDILNQTSGEGWLIELYGPDGITILEDTNGNGVPDTGVLGPLSPNQIINITIKIIIPPQRAGNHMDTIITAVPEYNQNGSDIATLRTETYPHIEVDKYASPTEIWVNGSAPSYIPQETTITLKAWGAGLEQFLQFPQDVVFVIDKSLSMDTNDPDPDGGGPRRPARVEAAWDYVDNMSLPDRAAVVKFSDNSILVDGPDDVPPFGDNEQTVWDLSSQYSDIKDNIDECGDASGGTSMGFGLEIAVDQLIANGNSSHIQVIIALTDGETWDATRAYEQAKRALDYGIRIYTIGLGDGLFGTGLPIWFLEHFIANTTGGKYYPAATPEALFGIYAQIGQEINEIAGKQIGFGTEKYLIRDVLPPWIHHVPGTFTIPPDNITLNTTGYTWLQWEKQYITINETWTCSFRIRSDMAGTVETNDFMNSRVKYTNWNNLTIEERFPYEITVNVRSTIPDPPQLNIDFNGTNIILRWIPPGSFNKDHYYIYRSPTRDDFGDFDSPWINTSFTADPFDPPIPVGDRTSWNDTTASTSTEYYYIVRTVDPTGKISSTSNTVGKINFTFPEGTSTFSLPLEPSYERNVSWYLDQIGSTPTDYIKWCDPATQTWVTHYLSDSEGTNDTVMRVGQGYEIHLAVETNYSFVGKPACSIRFLENQMPRPQNFLVTVNAQNVSLSWNQVPGADHYIIYRATTREGLNDKALSYAVETTSLSWNDSDPKTNIGGNEFYYAVGAVDSPLAHTCYNTTYSIGVWIGDYPAGYSAFGLPVNTFDSDTKTIDSYCDDIPNTVGINYYLLDEDRWAWHRFNMPSGAYDEVMGYAKGYQLSTSSSTTYYYVGK